MRKIVSLFLSVAVISIFGILHDSFASTVKIGAAVSLTGRFAREGKFTRDGYLLWEKVVNQNGGLKIGKKRYKVKIVYYDDESNPTKSARLYEKLITDDKVIGLLGPYSSGITIPTSSIAEKYKIPMVEAEGASDKIFSRGYKFVFATLPLASNYFRNILGLMTKIPGGPKNIAIVHSDAAFDTALAKGIVKWARSYNLKIVSNIEYTRGSTDLSTIIIKLKMKKPDAIIVTGHSHENLMFLRQAAEGQLRTKFLAFSSGVQSADFRKTAGKLSEGLFANANWVATLPTKGKLFGTAADYAKLFKKTFGYEPPYQSAEATAAAIAIGKAIENTGNFNPIAIRNNLRKLKLKTFYGYLHFNKNGSYSGSPVAIQVQQGKICTVYPLSVATCKPIYPIPSWSK